MCKNEQKPELDPEPWKKRAQELEPHMKTKSSGAWAGAIFMKRRAPEPELCYYYDSSAALVLYAQCVQMIDGSKNAMQTWASADGENEHLSSPLGLRTKTFRKPEVSRLYPIIWLNSCNGSWFPGMTLTLHKS